ncbi:MAG: ABATE domain-containing protein [Pseudonocardiales bacterium]|nr:ABATE domain-containing protein [Pseudonocardiales bacterium]
MTSARGAEFVLLGGRPSLDIVATLGRRHTAAPVERVPDPESFARWLLAAGVLQEPAAVSDPQLLGARTLRESIYGAIRASMDARAADQAALDVVNSYARRPDLPPQLYDDGGALQVAPGEVGEPVAAALATIARDAVHLLGGPQARRIKRCDHPDCSTLFVDETQAARRRWCSMERCGNQIKVAGYRRRRPT